MIIGAVLLIIAIINRTSNNRRRKEEIERQDHLKREKEAAERQRLARKRIEQQQAEEQLSLKKEQAEKQRLEDLKYETVEVVYAYTYEDKKPRAAVKRSDNTYNFVERENTQFVIGQEIKLLKAKTNTWNWIDEKEFQKEKIIKQQEVDASDVRRKKIEELKQKQERIVGTKWNVTQTATDLKDAIFEFCSNGILKYGDKISKWELKDEQIIISHNNGYAILTGQIIGNIISGEACNVVGNKWTFRGVLVLECSTQIEKIIGTRWEITQPGTNIRKHILEFHSNGILKYGNAGSVSKWKFETEQIVMYINNGYATLIGQITDDYVILGTANNIKGAKWSFECRQIISSTDIKRLVKPVQKESCTGRQAVEEYNQCLDAYRINYLYHMTHKTNLETILQFGLKSHNDARENDLMQNDIANRDVNDRRSRIEPIYNRSLHDYVPLYFNPKNSMLFVRKNIQNDIIILAIDRTLVYSENTIFTDGNAANRPTRFFKNINDLNQINWKCIRAEFWNDFEDGKRERMAEILVYPEVPVKCIQKIYCNSLNTLQYIREVIKKYPYIEVEQKRSLYF